MRDASRTVAVVVVTVVALAGLSPVLAEDTGGRSRTLPDVSVAIGTNAAQLELGDQYLATITVTNASSGATAEGVELVLWGSFMSLTGLTVTAGVNGSCALVTSDWVCTFTDPIPTGLSRTVFAYGDTNVIGDVTLFAQASAANGDSNPGNNYDSETTPVVIPAGLELTVTSTIDGDDATPGDGMCETAAGNGVCTLRAAVQEANALPGRNTVTIAVTGTITVTNFVTINDGLLIRSGLAGNAVISGGGAKMIFLVSGAADADVDFERLNLVNASSSGTGSAVWLFQAGDATFVECVFSGNTTTAGGAVGVASGVGNLLFDRCVFADNTSGASGAGIVVYGDPIYQRGVLEISASSFNSNSGGSSSEGGGAVSILSTYWDVLITDTSFLFNSDAVGGGGAITLDSTSLDPIVARVERSAFVGNSADGADGGAIQARFADLHLVNCTFADNHAVYGGAVSAGGGRLALSETTFADNTAEDSGGGVAGSSSVQVLAAASVFSGNTPASCAGITTLSGSFNLSSDASCTFSGAANLISTPALLGEAVGGPGGLIYLPPLAGSPAVDSAGQALCLDAYGITVVDDMLGDPRPEDGDGNGIAACDRGAREAPAGPVLIFGDGFENGSSSRWSVTVG